MAIIPMRQHVFISRAAEDDDGKELIDDWGNPVTPEEKTYFISPYQTILDDGRIMIPCRIAEGSELVTNSSGGNVTNSAEVARARILIDKLADIRYTDEISYTNELGITITRKPKEINVKRLMSSKPVLTEVFI